MYEAPLSNHAEPLKPETLKQLDDWRSGFNGIAFEIEWSQPEVQELEGKRILVAPSGAYWTVGNELPAKCTGHRTTAIQEVSEALEEGGFIFGGEQLAQAIMLQKRYDAAHR